MWVMGFIIPLSPSLETPVAKDLSAVHAELRPMAKFLPRLPFRRWNIPLLQRLMRLQPGVKPPAGVLVEDVWASRADGAPPLRLRIYQPAARLAPTPALVWMHGGGYFIGLPEQNDPHLCYLVQQLGIVILSVEYRLAPAHPFPTPLEDGYAALTWAHSRAGLLKNADPQRLAVGGESAGGGLAAALAQLAHDRGEVQPVFQLLVYPMLDDRTVLREDINRTEHLLWSPENNRLGWELYLHQPVSAGPLPPYAAAARRADLSGLPPAWIGVGTLDLFYEEDLAYAQRLKDSGVACETAVVPGAFHGFDQFGPRFQVVRDFREAQVSALRKYLFGD